MKKISIVIPVYGSPNSLSLLHSRVVNVMRENQWNYELILVNDACPKNSWEQIRQLCEVDTNVKGINLSRNFGQHYAISAGLKIATGAVAIVMDCDLQDRPEEIPNLISVLNKDVDMAFGRSQTRGKSNWFTKFTSKVFYKLFAYLTDNSKFTSNTSFVALSQKAYSAINQLNENKRLFIGLLQYVGFKFEFVDVTHDSRLEGDSSYSISTRIALAFRGITNSSTRLLRTGILVGIISSASSFIYGVYLVLAKLIMDSAIQGWTSSIVSTFFVGGVIMILIGILGVYIEVIFWEVKKRPVYVIKDKLNMGDKVHVKKHMEEVRDTTSA